MRLEEINSLIARLKSSKGKGDDSKPLKRAIELLEALQGDGAVFRDVLFSLLSDVLKPLFAANTHPNLTPAGRKNLVLAPAPVGRFNTPLLEGDRAPWKQAAWFIGVLRFVVVQYRCLPTSSSRDLVEGQFYLLVPPILTLIDDGDISYKTSGCELLGALCNTVSACRSTILSRSGLADVFADSLKANFMLLPTLTPENESLKLLRQLYPAFRALVSATYPPESESASSQSSRLGQNLLQPSTAGVNEAYPHHNVRQQMLDMILRHGILASYNHASDYVAIAEFLIHEAALVISDMQLKAVKYLSRLLPLLRGILTNPFVAAYPPLLEAACDLLSMLIITCKPRVASTWWIECLRMCVDCWVVIREDLPEATSLHTALVAIVKSLREVAGEAKFREAADTLITETEKLKDLLFPV